jgi:tRNA (guanine-N7-)-methyltransferase
MAQGEKQRQAFQFYGRRKGRPLRKGRQSLFDELLPRITVPLSAAPPLDPASLFTPRKRAVWLEIGFGGGEHLAHQAATNPEIGFIGCEVFESGIASGLSHIAERSLENVRLHPEDARTLLAALKPQSLERVFLLFPDPWPKRRHAQRRFVNRGNLDRLAALMQDDGELRIFSDDPTYIEWTLQHVPVHPAFQWLAESPSDWQERPIDAIETRYEKKAREAGRVPHFFRFKKNPLPRLRGRMGGGGAPDSLLETR